MGRSNQRTGAVNNMTTWDPKLGELFIRETCTEKNGIITLTDCHLGCIIKPRLHESAGLRYTLLLNASFCKVSPAGCFCTFSDFATGAKYQVNENTYVTRRLASDTDLHIMLSKWDEKERVRPDEWLSKLEARCFQEEDGTLLTANEYNRLGLITQEYMGHSLNVRFPFVRKYEFGTFGGKS